MAEEIEEDKEAKTTKKEQEDQEKPPEEEHIEEDHPKEEHPEEEPAEEKPTKDEPLGEKPPEEEPTKEEHPEEAPSKEEPPGEEPREEEPIEEEPPQEEHPEKEQYEYVSREEQPEEQPSEEEHPEEEPPVEEPQEEEQPKEEPTKEEPPEKVPPEEELPEEEPSEEKPPEKEPSEKEPPEEEHPEEEPSEEEPSIEELPKEEPPEVGPPELKEVREYDADELRKEIDRDRILEKGEKSPEMLLTEIKEERRLLEEERAKLRKEMKQKERVLKKREEKEEEEETTKKPKAIKSFAKERRKRRELERLRDYLFIGEYLLLVALVMALLYAEGISFNPVYLPFENSIFLIIVFFLVFKGEKLYFRFLNMKYSGTLQRKVIGVEHYKAVEFPPMMLTGFVVAVLLIPITSGIINIVIDMISFDREIIPFSSGFTFKLAMFLLASLIMSMAWVFFLIRFREKVIVPELEKIKEPFVIEDVFIITNSGLLVSHAAIESKPNVDEDILSSMLTAVKEFVKDSFGSSSEEGELDELQYGKVRVIIEYGKHVYLATVVRGQESMELRPEMKRILKGIQRKFGRTFDTWDGDLDQLKGVDSMAFSLINMG